MDGLPFNEETLSSLTKKINAKLDGSESAPSAKIPNTQKQKEPVQKQSKKKAGPGKKRQPDIGRGSQFGKKELKPHPRANEGPKSKANEHTKPRHGELTKSKSNDYTKSKTNGHLKASFQTPSTAANKRMRNGDLKSNGHSQPAPRTGASQQEGQLLEAIVELGGTEADLDLIQDAESGSELGVVTDKVDKKIGKELRNLVRELGITAAAQDTETSESGATEDSASEVRVYDDGESEVLQQQPSLKNLKKANTDHPPSRLMFAPRAEWHSAELPRIPEDKLAHALPKQAVDQLHQRAKDLLDKENELYTKVHKSSSSAHHFYSTIMASGTLTDKISALTLSVQESPLHNMRAFESLLGLARKRSRAQAIDVLNAIKDLFAMGTLIPSTRHLYAFSTQPALSALSAKTLKNYAASHSPPKPLEDLHLLLWAYEDWLKTKYFEVLQILETWLSDEILYSRLRAVDMTFELLRGKPEQEANLLRLLVNKLGDTEKKVASKASYNILQLQIPHPSMASNVIASIESDVLFRPGQNLHAKYYAMITLNQTVLSSKDEKTVKKVLDIYFSMFLSLLKDDKTPDTHAASMINKKGQTQGGGGRPGRMSREKKLKAALKGVSVDDAVRERIMSAVLTGINRAIPYTDTTDEFFGRHLDTLFRVTHSANFNTSIQSLMLIQQLCESHPAASDRFYRTLYESLLDPRLLVSSKQVLYLNLLYRALKADLNIKRIQAFAKRLLQCVAMQQPAFACGIIYLLRELEGVFPGLALLIDQPEEDAGVGKEQYPETPEAGKHTTESTSPLISHEGYDGRKRAPEHSNADRTCLWELDPFLEHFHPSVSLFANRLLRHEAMPPKPDLDSHTLIHFLDRFVYRNPKKASDKMHGSSIMQPHAAPDSSGLLIAPGSGRSTQPVNTEAFLKMQDENVKADEVFFHKYFNTKARAQGVAKSKKDKRQKTAEDSEDDKEEEEIWQALVDSRPEIEGSEGDEDADMDMDMDDLSDLEDESPFDMEEDGESSDEGVELNFDDEEDPASGAEDEAQDEDEAAPKQSAAKKRRKFLKSLPTFASAEDYAGMVDDLQGEEVSP